MAIFAPAAGYMLLGSELVNLAGQFLNNLFDSHPEWYVDVSLDLMPAIGNATSSGIYFFMEPNEWARLEAKGYSIKGNHLVDSTGSAYSGDEPYLLISIDGRGDRDLENYQAAALTADIAGRFLTGKDSFSTSLEFVGDLLTIGNDYRYREQADAANQQIAELQKQLDGTTDDATRKTIEKQIAELTKERGAYVGNIHEPDRRPKY